MFEFLYSHGLYSFLIEFYSSHRVKSQRQLKNLSPTKHEQTAAQQTVIFFYNISKSTDNNYNI